MPKPFSAEIMTVIIDSMGNVVGTPSFAPVSLERTMPPREITWRVPADAPSGGYTLQVFVRNSKTGEIMLQQQFIGLFSVPLPPPPERVWEEVAPPPPPTGQGAKPPPAATVPRPASPARPAAIQSWQFSMSVVSTPEIVRAGKTVTTEMVFANRADTPARVSYILGSKGDVKRAFTPVFVSPFSLPPGETPVAVRWSIPSGRLAPSPGQYSLLIEVTDQLSKAILLEGEIHRFWVVE